MDKRNEMKLKINDPEPWSLCESFRIMHKKEFVLDFIAMLPPEAIVNIEC